MLGAPSGDLQLSRGFLCLRTMLLRHPHAAPRNALQRKMAGGWGEPGLPAEGPGGLLQSREGCALQASLPGHWRRACPRSWVGPRLPTPSHHPCNRRTRGGPRALLADFSRRQPEGGKALTHSASGLELVLISAHTLSLRVTSHC